MSTQLETCHSPIVCEQKTDMEKKKKCICYYHQSSPSGQERIKSCYICRVSNHSLFTVVMDCKNGIRFPQDKIRGGPSAQTSYHEIRTRATFFRGRHTHTTFQQSKSNTSCQQLCLMAFFANLLLLRILTR